MSGDVEFDTGAKCDACGTIGAWDFMGDLLCLKCAGIESQPCGRCGHEVCICGLGG